MNPTITLNMAYGSCEMTAGNIQLAQEELDQNTLGLSTGMLVAERKTLEWVMEEFREKQEQERTQNAAQGSEPKPESTQPTAE